MNRKEVIQKIITTIKARSYLEIGVATGDIFLRIKAKRKTAVDPNYLISNKKKRKWMFKNFCNITAKYYKTTSDDFFAHKKSTQNYDVVFVDGLHTFAQSLRDVNNSLANLAANGVIVMHDCNPPHDAAAFPSNSFNQAASSNTSGWTGEWSGDVWKAVCHLRSFRNDLNVFVLDCDCGLGIITHGEPESNLTFTEEKFNQLTYDDFAKNKELFLNLKPVEFLNEFLNCLK